MGHTIADIAKAVGAEAFGATELEIASAAEPADAGPDDLALAMNQRYAEGLSKGRARAAMLWQGADWQALGLEAAIIPQRPRFAMAGLTAALDLGPGYGRGIHPTAIIREGAEIGEGVSLGAFCVIGERAKIGPRTVLGPQVYVGTDAVIGEDSMLHVGARIGARVTIGARFIAQAGATIGMDGFSFVTPEENAVEQARATLEGEVSARPQAWARIASLGSVIIGDDVEVGSNSAIDAGTIRATRIGRGTKLDNLVHIAHNVVVGEDCLFAGMVGIAGSTTIGNNCVFGGQVGVTDNTTVGDGVVAGGAAVILSKVPAGRVVLGYPAVKMDSHMEMYKALRRLPRMAQELAEMKAELAALKSQS
ncbi:UDP-3-O-(3-hydroxymyristoyl)glucosamine N-acyltransferase [Aquicoccus sp. G2-2]|uniref:UDP-3-O-(3-hydroxymyristoyl)glucosamine N-acyltransferase n=1 Tax=Aquicoccus sp. G2-2 TaxID=3092120 RepID=UPI002ADFA4D9|nr:UDP-3-O-(3-hydroxymyristoyl)glucosamine N-acyltransferase [Aquicoccus sp. G2-2]MEA1113118.1 UDP-3-O-(3-hydroxymyristoyl)glucosamine N-acyltransferase [Aquicoccus sp. G2-2]